jgi:arginyl-tRNA synthetase
MMIFLRSQIRHLKIDNRFSFQQLFHEKLKNLDLTNFKEIIPDFHNLPLRLIQFEKSCNYKENNCFNEIALIKKLSTFPKKMDEIYESLEPRKLATYLEEVAASYHKFYGNHKVINLDNIPLSYARKNLCNATQIILKTGLSILGITAPEKM